MRVKCASFCGVNVMKVICHVWSCSDALTLSGIVLSVLKQCLINQ